MQKLAIVYYPNINSTIIDSFRKKYDSLWQIISLHVTIVSPLFNVSEDQLIDSTELAVRNLKSFSIRLNGLKKSVDGCLFLQVKEGSKKLIVLHKKLYSGIVSSSKSSEYSFEPHITLGCFRKSDNTFDIELFANAYDEAEKMNIDIVNNVDRLSIIRGDGLRPATTIKTVFLK